MDAKGRLIRHITALTGQIYRAMGPDIAPDWFTSNITVSQLRVLLVLYTEGPTRMSALASHIGVALPTVTGIVDKLVKKEMVTRNADPEDRRLVICRLSPYGQETVGNLWALGRFHIKNLLAGLSVEQLQMADAVAGLLLKNVTTRSTARDAMKI